MVFKPVKQRFQFVVKAGTERGKEEGRQTAEGRRRAYTVRRQIARFAGDPKIYNELI